MDEDISVTVEVDGHELTEDQEKIISNYERSIETFIRKNQDYGNSFEDSAKVESILKHGEVRTDAIPEIVSRQIFVRGFMDKVSRFYQLAFEQDEVMVEDESVIDTLLDLGNYAIMLASLLEKYDEKMHGGAETMDASTIETSDSAPGNHE